MAIITQAYTVHVAGLENQTSCIRSLYLEVPRNYPHFQPGQVVQVHLPQAAELLRRETRPYSICSLPTDNTIELCIDRVNEQGVSGALHQLRVGDLVEISAPKGKFLLSVSSQEQLLLMGIGSGAGVTRGLMRHYYQLMQMDVQPVHFYVVNCDETAIPYQNQLEVECDAYPRLEVYPILQTNGYDIDEIYDRILSHSDLALPWRIFMAGPMAPLESLHRQLLDAGFPQKSLKILNYG